MLKIFFIDLQAVFIIVKQCLEKLSGKRPNDKGTWIII